MGDNWIGMIKIVISLLDQQLLIWLFDLIVGNIMMKMGEFYLMKN